LKLSILADQLGSSAGGGRFTNGFLRALLSDSDALARIEKLDILVTANQPTAQLYPLPPQTRVIHRRFPSRLRPTILANWASRTFPSADIAHGPFFYVFPSQGRRTLITFHDASFLDDKYHRADHNHAMQKLMKLQFERCAAVVCISRTVLSQVQDRWPQISDRCCLIYPGVDELSHPVDCSQDDNSQSAFMLAVGTVEPRKNYATLLDAYEQLRTELGDDAPQLVIVGKAGWMSEAVCSRLVALANRGWLRWLQTATDAELARLYQTATLFTYLSLYEGFGYPPFEAAYAKRPMVVSAASSVGEIWSGYARCVEPSDVCAIVSGWKWVLGLSDSERQSVVGRQYARASEFSWKRCVTEYVQLYETLAQQSE
jgi:glycosyltransferase involved in cell wall biosynthesis